MRRRRLLVGIAMALASGCDGKDETAAMRDLGVGGVAVADLSAPELPAPDLLAPAPIASPDLSWPSPTLDLGAVADDLAAPQGPALFIVDDTYAASGFEGGGSPAGSITDDQTCPMRGGSGQGKCHHIEWTAGTKSWGGVVWQYPANNWGNAPGYAIAGGYGQVRFWAWGKHGGESVSFLVGLGAGGRDRFQQRLDVTLAAQPTLYVLGVRGAYGADVVSAFGWVTGAAAPQTFYIDDIVWAGDDEGNAGAPPSFAVDTKFGPSGFMGDGADGLVSAAACAAPQNDGSCHEFVWDPNRDAGITTQGWAGVFWQSAPGDWGRPGDPDGAPLPTGYREVRFWAWSAGSGGANVSFLAGYGADTRDGWQSKLDVQLTTTPTLYTLGIGGGYGAHVAGGFGWVASGNTDLGLRIAGATFR